MLEKLLNDPAVKEDEDARDNLVAAYIKIALSPASGMNVTAAMQTILRFLPLTADDCEAELVYPLIIGFLDKHADVLGEKIVQDTRDAVKTLLESELIEDNENVIAALQEWVSRNKPAGEAD